MQPPCANIFTGNTDGPGNAILRLQVLPANTMEISTLTGTGSHGVEWHPRLEPCASLQLSLMWGAQEQVLNVLTCTGSDSQGSTHTLSFRWNTVLTQLSPTHLLEPAAAPPPLLNAPRRSVGFGADSFPLSQRTLPFRLPAPWGGWEYEFTGSPAPTKRADAQQTCWWDKQT